MRTALKQRIECQHVCCDETWFVDEIAEHGTVSEKRRRLLVLRAGKRNQCLPQPIHDLDRLTSLIDTLGIACPAGDYRRRTQVTRYMSPVSARSGAEIHL